MRRPVLSVYPVQLEFHDTMNIRIEHYMIFDLNAEEMRVMWTTGVGAYRDYVCPKPFCFVVSTQLKGGPF